MRNPEDAELDPDAEDRPDEPAAPPAARAGSLAANARRALRAARTDTADASTSPDTEIVDAQTADTEAADADVPGVGVSDVDVSDVDVSDVDVSDVDVSDADVSDADVSDADVSDADTHAADADTDANINGDTDGDAAAAVVLTKTNDLDAPTRPRRSNRTGTRARTRAATKAPAKRAATRTTTSAAPRRRAGPLTIALAVLTVLALVFAVIAGVVWWQAGHDSARSEAAARDAVILDARLDIAAVNTSDYQKASAALTKWLSVSTGSLHDQFSQQRADAITLLKQSQIVTSATVLDAAVTELNISKGTATVIASVNLRKQPAKGAAATQRNRFRASMKRAGGTWKLADLTIVSVQLS